MKTLRYGVITLCALLVTLTAVAADYTDFLTPAKGFTEVTTTDGMIADGNYYYVLASAENTGLIVSPGEYEAKPAGASDNTKALRYRSVGSDPILDLTNFFTIEKSGSFIGFRNVIYNTDLFQTHENAGQLYVNSFTDKTLDEWSCLTPTYQNGYWLFESGKYPLSSGNQECGYMGPWNKRVEEGEAIALNRHNTVGDRAGHYRLFRIARNDLMALRLYATILTEANGFTEVTTIDGLSDDPAQCYLITSAEQPGLFVGLGKYEAKPEWAGEDTKALRYRQAGNPVADLSNFFTIEKAGTFIGFRNVVEKSSLFQTHDNAGFMYVLTYTEPTMSDWCYLSPTFQNGYWLFESGKYPMSSQDWACGYLGPWNKKVEADEPIALNRRNIEGDEAGHYRLWRIARTSLFQLMRSIGEDESADLTWKITNPSFETGDETGWTLHNKENGNDEFRTRTYDMTGRAGNYLMNAWQWWATSLNVSQVVENLPSGRYELSGMMAAWNGRPVTLSANDKTATVTGVHDCGGIKVKVDVTIDAEGQLTINAGCATDWWTEGRPQLENEALCFFKLDDVQLHCKKLFLDALAVRLPNDGTKLIPEQWYYYDTEHFTECALFGELDGLVYYTNGQIAAASVNGFEAKSTLRLNAGRTYFKTSATDATLVITPYRSVEEGSFTAVALNVDGLPNKIGSFVLNNDGPGSEGSKKISQYLASKDYDVIGCSEDFNYHGSLMSYLNDNYSSGTVRKTLSVGDLPVWQILQGNFRFDTDGLNLIWNRNTVTASNESWTTWDDMEPTEGNQYVKKGFRRYDLWLGGHATIDVYVLHMDAGDASTIWSRESQWRQLADAINNSDHTRAKLIIGDTNSRWTRENITTNFKRRLSSDFTMSDVWVELCLKGAYPNPNMWDLTDQSDPTDFSKYEVVDKIIYINPKAENTVRLTPKSFKIEQDYIYDTIDHNGDTRDLGDHRPVVVTFRYKLSRDVAPVSVADIDNINDNDAWYDLSGRRIPVSSVLPKGVFIHRGRKMVIK